MTLTEIRKILADRLDALEQRIQAACLRAGRLRSDVTLVAVTKYVGPEIAGLLPELGVLSLGESRPQELWRKAAALPKNVSWHLVGHLQTNKIEKTLPLVWVIHSVDSVRLLKALYDEGLKRTRPVDVLLEVNMSREPNKHGFTPEDLLRVQDEIDWKMNSVSVLGLMTMAAAADDPEQARPAFRELRQLSEKLREKNPDWGNGMWGLSMGMTHDFEVAIEEGATHIRVGSALFEGLPESPS